MSAYPNLFSPIEIGPVTLPSRLMMGSMHTGLEAREGGIARLAAFYAERARGGTGLIVTGGWSPNRAGRLTPEPAVFDSAGEAARHRAITDAVHAAGGRILLQLVHAGRYGYHCDIVAPSALKSPINRDVPRELTGEEIEQTIADFAAATALAVEAGYDGVEVMGSEGYLITQFLAERTNRRSDEWGGPLPQRARFALEIVARVRAALGAGRLLLYRISALDLVEGGLSRGETQWLAREVAAAGADALDTGIGWHEARTPTIAGVVPHGGFAFALGPLKQAVSIPVIATNRINTPELAERLIADGTADMVSLARPLLADAAFAAKAKAGAPERINTCIACNQACLDHYFESKVVSCLVNPYAGYETRRRPEPAPKPKRIAVAGAGPAGLAAAITLAERGHRVTLFETSGEIGGQFKLARAVPGKEDFAESIRYWRSRIGELGIALELGTAAGPERLGNGFDEVVLATGVIPRGGVVEGEDHPKVASYADILNRSREAGQRVAIVGAGGIGFDVALFLLEAGGCAHLDPEAFRARWGIDGKAQAHPPCRRITMLKRSEGPFGRTLGKSTGWVHRLQLAEAGVEQIAGVIYRRIDDEGLHIEVGGEARVIPADTVVICAGQEREDALAAPLAAKGIPVHVIGGAREPVELDAERAIAEGVDLGLAL